MLDIDATKFLAAAPFIATDRYYLAGIYIEPAPQGGVYLVATDGHAMLVAYDSEGHAESGVLIPPSRALLSAAKPKRRSDGPRRLRLQVSDDAQTFQAYTGHNGEARTVHETGVWEDIDAVYPDWRSVVPLDCHNGESACPAFLTSDLARVSQAAKTLTGRTASLASIIAPDLHSPAIVHFHGVDDAFAVLMPRRQTVPDSLPEWFSPPATKAA